MFGYGPFETSETGARSMGRRTPRWARVALFGPYSLLIVWVLAEAIGSAPSWLFWVVIGSIVLGSGSVVIACLYHLSAARVSRTLASRRKPNA